MNKVLTSAILLGAGVAAVSMTQKNHLMDAKQMKKIQKRISKLF